MRGAAVVMPAAPRFVFISLTEQGYPANSCRVPSRGREQPRIKKPGALPARPASGSNPFTRRYALALNYLCYATLVTQLSAYATLGVRLRELRWKNSAWLATADTIAGWNGLEIRKAGSGRSPVRKRSG